MGLPEPKSWISLVNHAYFSFGDDRIFTEEWLIKDEDPCLSAFGLFLCGGF